MKNTRDTLFTMNKKTYIEIKQKAKKFNAIYNGNNIIHDQIFMIIENYVTEHNYQFNLLKFPFNDNKLCSFTFENNNHIFLSINSNLDLSKQIFAAAHELYHIICLFENKEMLNNGVGTPLDNTNIIIKNNKIEDLEANAFAGILLAPLEKIIEQSDIYHIHLNNINVEEIIKLINIFSIPYKAICYRLLEERIINKEKMNSLLLFKEEEIENKITEMNPVNSWYGKANNEYYFGSLKQKMDELKENGYDNTTFLEDIDFLNRVEAS